MRPVLANGISDIVTRPDLLDRAVQITLPPIPEGGRRTEKELWRAFEEARPRILGALLGAVSTAMRNIGSVRLDSIPRMADFCAWAVASESALPWPNGVFIRDYR